ncbi:MAG TPA: alpha/beta hydrolase [Anaerolineae bacterium]|nr:alpha/beta hydrolase [Anaerolineae bacterium]
MNDLPSPFKSAKGETEYMAAYETMMRYWPVPYESIDLPGYYGCTHLVVCGPIDAPPLVLLHGGRASLTMWAKNVGDLSRDYRVYAIDVMGQPSKSIPDKTFKTRDDLIPWFTGILDALNIPKADLVGQSYGGWFTLNYAIHVPDRVNKIVLISPAACFLPLNTQHMLRGALMFFFPSRWAMKRFKRWETCQENLKNPENQAFDRDKVEQLYLGFKYFRCQGEDNPDIFSDDELRSVQAPTLLLIGQQEVIYDPVASVERARNLIPHLEADLIPCASHDLTYFQASVVDERILIFLNDSK